MINIKYPSKRVSWIKNRFLHLQCLTYIKNLIWKSYKFYFDHRVVFTHDDMKFKFCFQVQDFRHSLRWRVMRKQILMVVRRRRCRLRIWLLFSEIRRSIGSRAITRNLLEDPISSATLKFDVRFKMLGKKSSSIFNYISTCSTFNCHALNNFRKFKSCSK